MHASQDIFAIARDLIRKKEFAEAEALLLEALEKDPMNALFESLLAETYLNTGKIDKALEANNRALAINPSDFFALQRKGDICALKKQYDEALEIFTNLLSSPKATHHLYRRIAKIYQLLKKPQKAIEIIQKAIEKSPHMPELHYQAYLFYRDEGMQDAAMSAITKAHNLDPANDLYRTAKLALRAKNETAEHLEEAMELSGDTDVSIMRILARKLKKEGRLEKAIEIFKKILALENSDFARKELAFAYYHNKEYARAFSLFNSLGDDAFLEAPFVTSITASAKTKEEKKVLLERMSRLASSGNRALWGRVNKLKKELAEKNPDENNSRPD